MSARGTLGLLGAALLITVSPANGQQTAEDLLQSGRYAEEVEDDLRAAVRIFQSILADFPSHRAVAATALVRIGRAFETLGQNGAQQAYQRVLDDYPDQAEAAAEARARLASIQSQDLADRRPGIVERQVSPDAIGGTISPDGRYVAFTDWARGAGGDPNLLGKMGLAVYDSETGRSRLVTKPPAEYIGYGEEIVWSADGERLAYRRVEGVEGLHVVDFDGANVSHPAIRR